MVPGKKAYVVCSPRARSGKTVLSRALTDYLLVTNANPWVFDSDIGEGELSSYFPNHATIADLDRVQGQMTVFDGLLNASQGSYVVDLAQRQLDRFFDIVTDIEFVPEAAQVGLELIVLMIVDRDAAMVARAKQLMQDVQDVRFVIVRNEACEGPEPPVDMVDPFTMLEAAATQLEIPRLDPVVYQFADGPDFSLSSFLSEEPRGMSIVARARLRKWLHSFFDRLYAMQLALDNAARAADPR